MEGTLAGQYRVAEIARDEYDRFRAIHEPVIFPNRFDVNVQAALSNGEKLATAALGQNLGKAYELRLGFFDGDEMIGWHYGMQVSADTYRMATTGLLPEYQGKGIYS